MMLSDLAAVTREQLNALGLDTPDDLADACIPLWRSSPKGKYHWADERSACQHLPGTRHWQHPKDRAPPKPSALVLDAREKLEQPPAAGFYRHPSYRPMATGAAPPPPYDNDSWSMYAARRALDRGAEFVYGCDDTNLLALALPPTGNWRVEARVQVELQTKCVRPHHDDEAHLCEVDGVIESVRDSGALVFTPNGMRDSVTIPPAYIAALVFT